MENLFEKVSDQELKLYYQQYKEWRKTGIIQNNELGTMRDYYFEHLGAGFHVVMNQFLLETIAERWINSLILI